MKVAVDANILVRAVVRDDEGQARAAASLLRDAAVVAITMPCLCELVWVLTRVYGFVKEDIRQAIEALLDAGNVAINRPATEAGLAILEAGGDFADGVITHEGRWLGGDTFVSFDQKAVALLAGRGESARVLGVDVMRQT